MGRTEHVELFTLAVFTTLPEYPYFGYLSAEALAFAMRRHVELWDCAVLAITVARQHLTPPTGVAQGLCLRILRAIDPEHEICRRLVAPNRAEFLAQHPVHWFAVENLTTQERVELQAASHEDAALLYRLQHSIRFYVHLKTQPCGEVSNLAKKGMEQIKYHHTLEL